MKDATPCIILDIATLYTAISMLITGLLGQPRVLMTLEISGEKRKIDMTAPNMAMSNIGENACTKTAVCLEQCG